jgi:hypothetical protein
MTDLDQIPLSNELLVMMRNAARHAQRLREMFITPRAILLALLDDAALGPVLEGVVDRGKIEALPPAENPRQGMVRKDEKGLESGEQPPLPRYDTLAFKTPDGKSSVWLGREAAAIFKEGLQRADRSYLPKHVAFGMATEAMRSPGILAALHVEPGAVTDAIYKM